MQIFSFVFAFLALSEPIVSPPQEVKAHSELPKPESAADWYEAALTQIREGNREAARESLKKALSLDPQLIEAGVQLGFLELWDGGLNASYQQFFRVLKLAPCEPKTLEGLREIGARWAQVETRQRQEIAIYQTLNTCQPGDADTLFYLGRAQARAGDWDEAIETLKECLTLAPEYGDAEVQLAYIYLWQEMWAEAEALFAKYPANQDAKIGLALAARRQGNSEKAKAHLQEILSVDNKHKQARQEYANILLSDMDYSQAETAFAGLVDDDPNASNYWISLFDIKSHTRYGMMLEKLYTYAKENDPSLGVPVVRDYYFFNSVHFLIPLMNRWRLDIEQIYYHQRENDIFPPVGVNYSAYEAGGQVTSSYFFAPNWRWDLSARAFNAWGKQDAIYPFKRTTRFEPGTGLLYNSERQLFSVDAHTESFIIKDFARNNSKLLRTDYLTGGYGYRFNRILRPEFEAWVTHIFIRDSLKNWENTEMATARLGIPFAEKTITAIYRFEHGHFDQLSQNYYSFKQQFRNVLGARLHIPFSDAVSWDTYYYHSWQTTYNLFQPIGDTVFVSPKQYLVANWVTSSLTARYKDSMRLILEGHYFHDTLIYRDWNITGSFLWQF